MRKVSVSFAVFFALVSFFIVIFCSSVTFNWYLSLWLVSFALVGIFCSGRGERALLWPVSFALASISMSIFCFGRGGNGTAQAALAQG